MAAHVGRSARRLRQAIRLETGRTFRDHLLAVRVEEARRLLAGTALPVREVARACGFPRADHFSRRFHQAAGLSPTRFRDEHRSPASAAPVEAKSRTVGTVLDDLFSGPDPMRRWSALSGEWRVSGGMLEGTGNSEVTAMLVHDLPQTFQLEFEMLCASAGARAPGTATLIALGGGGDPASSGYRAWLGHGANSERRFQRRGTTFFLREGSLSYDSWHRVSLRLVEDSLVLSVDDNVLFHHREPLPLPWRERCRLVIGGWDATLRFRSLRVLTLAPTPASDALARGDARAVEADFERTLDIYEAELRRAENTPRETDILLKTGLAALRLGLSVRGRNYMQRYLARMPGTVWGTVAAMETLRSRMDGMTAAAFAEEVLGLLSAAPSPVHGLVVIESLQSVRGELSDRGDYEKIAALAPVATRLPAPLPPYVIRFVRNAADALFHRGDFSAVQRLANDVERDGRFSAAEMRQLQLVSLLTKAATDSAEVAMRLLDSMPVPTGRAAQAERETRRAILLQAAGDIRASIETWSRVAEEYREVEPLSVGGAAGAAQLLALIGRDAEADTFARQVEDRQVAATAAYRGFVRRSLFAIRGNLGALLTTVEETADARHERNRDTIRWRLFASILEEIVGNAARARRNLEILERSFEKTPWWRLVLPVSYLLGKRSAEEVWKEVHAFCFFSDELSSSSLYYMLALVMRKRGDEAAALDLFRLAVKADPFNYWPALLAKRELTA